ncbi:hypothetical protein DPMN_128321 [Dreissena polymorpha]|uniref:Uncharacterized protein n=1 Tax=Dreissena polymorpha TaxID=45954 RepID=A0A9D4JWA9_DREPO|nr:hypothetical protein DPMN_128321 [Dreissena polymorpha]
MYDFPISSSSPRIPHIIHQTYTPESIPMDFQKNVQSSIRFNPNWKYMFWTDETARKFIQAMYPDSLVIWDNYRNNVNKADALRYFVMYEFGGIYADLDFECIRPLDPVTRIYAAIFPLEPFEHSALRYEIPFLLHNAIMMSKPKHPFLKHMIDNLSAFQALWEQLDVAGPCFVQRIISCHITTSRQVTLTNSVSLLQDVNAVYIPNTHFFMNTLATIGFHENGGIELCLILSNDSSAILKRGCNELRRRKSPSIENFFDSRILSTIGRIHT